MTSVLVLRFNNYQSFTNFRCDSLIIQSKSCLDAINCMLPSCLSTRNLLYDRNISKSEYQNTILQVFEEFGTGTVQGRPICRGFITLVP